MTYLYAERKAKVISSNPHPVLFTLAPSADITRKDQIEELIRLNCPEKCEEKNHASAWQIFAKGLEVLRP